MRVLIVEDEPRVGEPLVRALRERAMTVRWITEYDAVLPALAEADPRFDVVLLDLILNRDGSVSTLPLCAPIGELPGVGLIVVTAHSSPDNAIAALEAGADDFVPKPFNVDVLTARIHAVARKLPSSEQTVGYRGLRIHTGRQQAWVDGAPIRLTRIRYRILLIITERRGDVCSSETIQHEIWGRTGASEVRSLHVHIAGLRDALGAHRGLVQNVFGVGYRLATELLDAESPDA